MSAMATLSELIARATGGSSGTPDNLWWFKSGRIGGAAATQPSANLETSLFNYEGYPGDPSSIGSGASVSIPTNVTDGGLKQSDPGGGRQK